MKKDEKGYGAVDALFTIEKDRTKSIFKKAIRVLKKASSELRGEMENVYLDVAIKCGTNNTETSIVASSVDDTEIKCSHCNKIIVFKELGRLGKSQSATISSHTILVLKTNRDMSM